MREKPYTFENGFYLFLLASICLCQELVEEGRNLFWTKRYDEAKEIFRRVLRSNPENAEANYFLGKIYSISGDYKRAGNFLEKAVQLDEGEIDYHLSLASVYQEKARRASFLSAPKWTSKWKTELETAFEIDPTNIEARRRLIRYYVIVHHGKSRNNTEKDKIK